MHNHAHGCCGPKAPTRTESAPVPKKSHSVLHAVALFGSFSTLFCCALPALLVAIGAGSVLVGMVSAVPQLVWLSEHKIALFTFSAITLTLSGIARYRTRNAPCPTDAAKARACSRMRKISFGIWCGSVAIYCVGFFFAFIAQYLV